MSIVSNIKKGVAFAERSLAVYAEAHTLAHQSKNSMESKVGHAILKAIEGKFSIEESAALHKIATLHDLLKNDKSTFQVNDFGEGVKGSANPFKETSISQLANSSSTKTKYGKILFSLIRGLKPSQVLELGTCISISAMYISSGLNLNKKGHLTSLEGDKILSDFSSKHLHDNFAPNTDIVTGQFTDTLPSILTNLPEPIKLVFLDGHHNGPATLQYFNQILPYTTSVSVFILDDIRWSEGMFDAWQKIISLPEARNYIDLFQWGIVIVER